MYHGVRVCVYHVCDHGVRVCIMVCECVSWCASACIMVCECRVSWCASVMSCIMVCECDVVYHVRVSCIMVCECDVVYHGVRV